MQHILIAFSVSCVLSGAAAGQIQFHDAVSYPTGKNPEGGALFDFDHDGDLDLAVSTEDPDQIELLRNQGGGVLQHALELPTGSGTSPEGLAAGDFDNDGEVDLAAALFSANQVQLVWNQGDGTFELGAKHAVQVEPSIIVAADFDDDGWLDVAVNNRVSGTVSVLRNDGQGGLLAAVHYAVGAETRCVAAADLDGDGLADLAVSSRDDRRVRLLRSLGGGAFETLVDLSLGAILKPQGVATNDFDVDGELDVITATSGTFPLQEHPSVFLQNNGSAHWVGPINGSVLPGVSPTGIASADFDLDGVPDAATSNADTNDVSVMRSSGIAGIFHAGTLVLPIGEKPEAPLLLAGDLDHNGGPDLVAFNVDGDTVSVLLNQLDGPVCQPDLGFAGPGDASLSVCGDALASGGSADLLLSGAPASSPAWIAGSLNFDPTPLLGGTIVTVPVLFVVPVLTDAAGALAVPGLPGGGGPLELYVQCAILDSGQPAGFALSNAVKLQFLP
jgi:hypothetical protein